MRRICFPVIVALIGGILLAGAGVSQDAPKIKGRLPDGWKNLGLSEVQKEKVYQIRASYREKFEALEQQLENLRIQERAEMVSILSDDQKEKLRQQLLGGLGLKEPVKKSPED